MSDLESVGGELASAEERLGAECAGRAAVVAPGKQRRRVGLRGDVVGEARWAAEVGVPLHGREQTLRVDQRAESGEPGRDAAEQLPAVKGAEALQLPLQRTAE